MDNNLLTIKCQIEKRISGCDKQYSRLVAYGRLNAATEVTGEIRALREVIVLIDKVCSE